MTIGIVVVVIFLIMALLMMLRKIPALLALPLMAVLIGLAGGLPLVGQEGILTYVLSSGALKLTGTYVAYLIQLLAFPDPIPNRRYRYYRKKSGGIRGR